MVNRYDWIPNVGGMTVLAHVCRVDMVEAFTVLDRAVVTTDAVADDAVMTKGCWQPGISAMAVTALSNSCNMTGRQAVRGATVMATRASANDL